MKMTMMLTIILGCLMFSVSSFADGEVEKLITTDKPSQSTEKRSRRKKVEMCNECGKPETQCECEGHGDDDNHSEDEH